MVNRYLRIIRQKIAAYSERSGVLSGEVALDEPYFGGKKKGFKLGGGAAHKVADVRGAETGRSSVAPGS